MPRHRKKPRALLDYDTIAAASTKYSGPFCIVIRPKKVTTFSFGFLLGTISCISCERGETALCTVDTFFGSWKYLWITV